MANIWKGVLVEESVTDRKILEYMTIVKTQVERLEGEAEKGGFHFHKVEVDDRVIDEVVQIAMKSIKKGWYLHLVNNNTIKVIFTEKVFEAVKGQPEQLKAIQQYGISLGILPEQMPFERLIDNPFDE